MDLDPLNTQDFITIWQGSRTLADVAKRCEQPPATVSARASRLRKTYPEIKKFRRQTVLTVPSPETAEKMMLIAEKGLDAALDELEQRGDFVEGQ